jgi:hypothetical protein
MPLRQLPEAFGLPVPKSWYPHYFNTKNNLDYVGQMPDVSQDGVDEMTVSEMRYSTVWFDEHKYEVFVNRRVLDKNC